jgi:hypothetical protein
MSVAAALIADSSETETPPNRPDATFKSSGVELTV